MAPLAYDHPSAPPEGYQFTDPSGVTLKADTLRALPAAIAAFRTTNGLPPGNPVAELETLYRVLHPHLVSKVGVTPTTAEDPVAHWINRLWKLPPKEKDFAESETVRVRLEACAACPHYHPEHSYGTETARRLTILSHARMSDFAACAAHHWPVGMAALMQFPNAKETVTGCWVEPMAE